MSIREEWEMRKQGIHDSMLSFVKQRPSAHRMKWQYEVVEKIVDGCSRLSQRENFWVPEFLAGTSIGNACDIAWAIHIHTNMPVRFRFNGVEITFTNVETKGLA